MDGERSDVAPGKENRTDNIGIRAERQSHAVHGKDCPIVQRIEEVVAKLRKDQLLDQLLANLSRVLELVEQAGPEGRKSRPRNVSRCSGFGRRAPEGKSLRAGYPA